jgi:hypothetical protein
MPFLIGAGAHVALYFYARPVLTTANIEAAKAEAVAKQAEPSDS